MNITYPTKLRHVSNWRTQTDSIEIIITLRIIVHQKLKRFAINIFDDLLGNFGIQSWRDSLFYKSFIQIYQSLHENILDQ